MPFDLVSQKPWNAPSEISWKPPVHTMLNVEERRMLRWLTREHYNGDGAIVDAGCFLGGSTMSLAQGLREGKHQGKIDSFDLFLADEYAASIWGGALDFRVGESFRHIFDRYTKPYADLIRVHSGDVTSRPWNGGPIEILFVDLAKTTQINDFLIQEMFTNLTPGRSILIQQDYLHYHLPWIHITMEKLRGHFALLCDTEYNSVVFGCIKIISCADAEHATWFAMTAEERTGLMNQAIRRWTGVKREYLIGALAALSLTAP